MKRARIVLIAENGRLLDPMPLLLLWSLLYQVRQRPTYDYPNNDIHMYY